MFHVTDAQNSLQRRHFCSLEVVSTSNLTWQNLNISSGDRYPSPLLTIFLFNFICSLFLQVVWMRNGREVKMGKKYEYMLADRKRILMVHNVTEEDVGIYECVLADDRMALQLSLNGTLVKKVV